MTKRPKPLALPRERTTLPLKGTTRTTQAALDHSSAFSLLWAQSWLSRAGSRKVPTGGVIRRALAVYVTHLESCPIPLDEVRAVARACSTFSTSEDTQQGAYERLQAVEEGAELPPCAELLHGPQAALDVAAMDARVDALMAQIANTRWGRLRGVKA